MPKTMADFVRDALTRVTEVLPEEVQKKIHKQEGIVILDVREGEEYQRGHLTRALWIPRGVLEGQAPRLLQDPGADSDPVTRGR